MKRTFYSRLIALFALLAFTSQVMAATAMTCELETPGQPVTVSMDMQMMDMDHSDPEMAHMHHHDSDKSPTSQHKLNCCKTMGHCLSGCSLIVISSASIFLVEKLSSRVNDFYSSNISNPVISSLYRPPIFA